VTFARLVLALVLAALALPSTASAGSLTTPNGCRYTFDNVWRNTDITLTGIGAREGSNARLTGARVDIALPAWLPEYGYNFGILHAGRNEIPAKIFVALAGKGTHEAVQRHEIDVTAVTTITDEGGVVTATPLAVDGGGLPDSVWSSSGAESVEFAQAGPGTLPGPLPVGPNGSNVTPLGSIYISATIGSLKFNLDCQPGQGNADGTAVVPALAGPFELLSFAGVAPAPPPLPKATIAAKRPLVGKRKLELQLGCSAGPERCSGQLVARTLGKIRTGDRKRRIVVARGSYSVAPDLTRTVRVSLTSVARKLGDRLAGRKVAVTLRPAEGERVVRVLKLR
jgi:hypothetical protein